MGLNSLKKLVLKDVWIISSHLNHEFAAVLSIVSELEFLKLVYLESSPNVSFTNLEVLFLKSKEDKHWYSCCSIIKAAPNLQQLTVDIPQLFAIQKLLNNVELPQLHSLYISGSGEIELAQKMFEVLSKQFSCLKHLQIRVGTKGAFTWPVNLKKSPHSGQVFEEHIS
jgi:hypothetical protein